MRAACAPSDARLVVAPQRILRLTMTETLNTVRYLIDDTEATALVTDNVIGDYSDSVESGRMFPPLQFSTIIGDEFTRLDRIADHVAEYVLANFAGVTGCPTATDACATAYLNKLAARAYRRPLTWNEQARFTALYTKLRSTQTVNGYEVTFSVEEATSYAVNGLLMSPQLLWRWEHGDPAMASTSPAGIPLTEHELASHLSFFLTDQPPSDALLAAASAGTLRANLTSHVEELLDSQVAQDWLRTIMETYFGLNQMKYRSVDTAMFPIFSPALRADMGIEVRKFLDNVLWHGDLTELLLSRRRSSTRAWRSDIYGVPVPPGATETNFVATTLPAGRRAGLLTNAAFLTSIGRADGRRMLVSRGLLISWTVLCMFPDEGPDGSIASQFSLLQEQTPQEQVAYRAAKPDCNACHACSIRTAWRSKTTTSWDATGPSTSLGQPIDAHATLARGAGRPRRRQRRGARAGTGGETRVHHLHGEDTLAVRDGRLDRPRRDSVVSGTPGCATVDVVQRYQAATGTPSPISCARRRPPPAFVLRRAAP